MVLEAGILSGDKGVDHVGGNLVVVGVDTVACATEETAYFFAVRRIKHRGKTVVGVLELLDGWHIADHAVVNQKKKCEYPGNECYEKEP